MGIVDLHAEKCLKLINISYDEIYRLIARCNHDWNSGSPGNQN